MLRVKIFLNSQGLNVLVPILILFVIAFIIGYLFEKIKLPALIGYMLVGICFSPYVLEFLELKESQFSKLFLTHYMINNSTLIREIALFIILYRAGLGLDRTGLKFHGNNAISLSILPCLLETITIAVCAMYLFKLLFLEALIIGFVVSAVSPAVIVPQMLDLQNKGIGTNKKIPTLVLAGSTIDDILAISGFGICLSILSVDSIETWQQLLIKIPLSLVAGAAIGYYVAKPLIIALKNSRLHPFFYVVALIAFALGFKQLEESKLFFFSHLIAIIALGISIQTHDLEFSKTLSEWFAKVWGIAVIALFVLIGAMVNPAIAISAGFYGLIILICGLAARSLGVFISLNGSKLNSNEKLFCVIAYLPKATVQATIGGIAVALFLKGDIKLYNGLDTGELIAAMAALSILFTAPLGAIGIRVFSKKLLENSKTNSSDIS